jgi:hypothetical protein
MSSVVEQPDKAVVAALDLFARVIEVRDGRQFDADPCV